MPKVTVIIPSYNHAKFIAEAIQSVLDQTYQDFDILICDDASIDNSVEIIKQFNDPRITLIVNENNMGACYGHNLMIRQSHGEYIALINSDDVWLPNKLAIQVEFLETHPQYAAVFSDVGFIKEDGMEFLDYRCYDWFSSNPKKTRYEWLRSFFDLENHLAHPTVLIKKAVYEKIGLYNPLLSLTPDFEMWVRVLPYYDIYVLPEKLARFRILEGNKNASAPTICNASRFAFEAQFVLDRFLNIPDITLLSNIFPDFCNLIKPGSKAEDIPFIIGIAATKNSNTTVNNWGARVLFSCFYANPELAIHYKETYGISQNDFSLLINTIDINEIKLHNERIELVQKQLDTMLASKDQYIHDLEQSIRNLETKLADTNQKLQSKEQELQNQNIIIQCLSTELTLMINSTSWKATSPLRYAGALLRKIKYRLTDA